MVHPISMWQYKKILYLIRYSIHYPLVPDNSTYYPTDLMWNQHDNYHDKKIDNINDNLFFKQIRNVALILLITIFIVYVSNSLIIEHADSSLFSQILHHIFFCILHHCIQFIVSSIILNFLAKTHSRYLIYKLLYTWTDLVWCL